jgi:hypothetical protein
MHAQEMTVWPVISFHRQKAIVCCISDGYISDGPGLRFYRPGSQQGLSKKCTGTLI